MITTSRTLVSDKVANEPAINSEVASFKTTSDVNFFQLRAWQKTPKSGVMVNFCLLRIHKGQWAYVAEGKCTQARECVRCESVHVRTMHQPLWRYIRE